MLILFMSVLTVALIAIIIIQVRGFLNELDKIIDAIHTCNHPRV